MRIRHEIGPIARRTEALLLKVKGLSPSKGPLKDHDLHKGNDRRSLRKARCSADRRRKRLAPS